MKYKFKKICYNYMIDGKNKKKMKGDKMCTKLHIQHMIAYTAAVAISIFLSFLNSTKSNLAAI